MKGARKPYRLVIPAVALLASAPLLTSCGYTNFELLSVGVAATANGLFKNPEVNLKEKNYAAADYLLQQSGNYLTRNSAIAVKPLSEADNPGITSPLGRKIPEDIGMRFAELGYTVNLSEVAGPTNKGLYGGSEAYPAYILTGSYLKISDGVNVSLRIISNETNSVISSFDYKMALSSEVRKMAEADTQIYRMPPPKE